MGIWVIFFLTTVIFYINIPIFDQLFTESMLFQLVRNSTVPRELDEIPNVKQFITCFRSVFTRNNISIRERKTFVEAEEIEEELRHVKGKFWKAKEDGEDDVEITFLQAEVNRLNTLSSALFATRQSFERDRDNLVKSQSKIMQDLHVTRTKRVEKGDFSDMSWSKMLLEIKENPRLKKQMNAMAYISFLATERMRGKLTVDYEYADGEIHAPMLLPEGVVNSELMEMVEALYVPKVEE